MSYSDSEIKMERKIKKTLQTLHIEFKRKKKNNELVKLMKSRFCPIMDELRLLEAVSVNNSEQVEKLLKSGVSPNASDVQNRSALHIAVSRGYADIVRLLLENGADPNKRDVVHNTPLHLAACTYNLPIITLLVQHGADTNCVDVRGRNPIELARSKLHILHKNLSEGFMGKSQVRLEMQEIVNMIVSIWMRKPQNAYAITHKPTSVDDLQFMALSLNDADEADCEMSKLLTELQEIKIS